MADDIVIKRALISVSDKRGLLEFAGELAEFGVRILSTGGTATALRDAGVAVIEVSHYTDFPEIMGGRVKTLHPLVHGGILADRGDEQHLLAMEVNNIGAIDLVVVNLYPFDEAVTAGADEAACLEEIDIGGITLLRAAAKNYRYVTVVTDIEDYGSVLSEMRQQHGATSYDLRRRLATRAFATSAQYDTHISRWFAACGDGSELFGERFFMSGTRERSLRYGENPHQHGAFYRSRKTAAGMAAVEQLQGKQLSYNNINDSSAAFRLVSEFSEASPACVIVKHATPCGAALAASVSAAYAKARACDPTSAFGGIVAVNGVLDVPLAEAIVSSRTGLFLEVLLATEIEEGVLEILRKKPQLRVLLTHGLWRDGESDNFAVSTVAGGFLVQESDSLGIGSRTDCTIATANKPDDKQWEDMLFAWKVVKHVRSNAIVLARDLTTVGICGGQTSRVAAAEFAIRKADEHLGAQDSVLASDAFFPFADAIEIAHAAEVRAVIQSGGSINDEDVIKAADKCGMAMVMTGNRHFRH